MPVNNHLTQLWPITMLLAIDPSVIFRPSRPSKTKLTPLYTWIPSQVLVHEVYNHMRLYHLPIETHL